MKYVGMNMPQIIIDSQYAKLVTLCMSSKLTQQLSNFDQTSNTLPDHVTRCVTNYSCLSSFTVELVKHSKWIHFHTVTSIHIFFIQTIVIFFQCISGKIYLLFLSDIIICTMPEWWTDTLVFKAEKKMTRISSLINSFILN